MKNQLTYRQQRALAFAQALVQAAPPNDEDEDKMLVTRAYQLADAMWDHEWDESLVRYEENEIKKAARYREEPDEWYTS